MNYAPHLNVLVNSQAHYWRRHPEAIRELSATANRQIRVLVTRSIKELGELFASRALSPADDPRSLDVIAGGDGSICRYLSCRRRYGRGDVPVLLLPTGTMNALANDLGITRSRSFEHLRALQRCSPWREQPRVSLDVTVQEQEYSGFVFETGFISHILNEFYGYAQNRKTALVLLLRTIGRLMNDSGNTMSIERDDTDLNVQSFFVTATGRMIFGLYPFGRSPQLPTIAEFRLTSAQRRFSWWRLISGHVDRLIADRSLILEPLLPDKRVDVATREPANLDGEMIISGDAESPAQVTIRRGATIRFVLETEH